MNLETYIFLMVLSLTITILIVGDTILEEVREIKKKLNEKDTI